MYGADAPLRGRMRRCARRKRFAILSQMPAFCQGALCGTGRRKTGRRGTGCPRTPAVGASRHFFADFRHSPNPNSAMKNPDLPFCGASAAFDRQRATTHAGIAEKVAGGPSRGAPAARCRGAFPSPSTAGAGGATPGVPTPRPPRQAATPNASVCGRAGKRAGRSGQKALAPGIGRVCETQCSFIDEICTRDFKSVWEKFRLPCAIRYCQTERFRYNNHLRNQAQPNIPR